MQHTGVKFNVGLLYWHDLFFLHRCTKGLTLPTLFACVYYIEKESGLMQDCLKKNSQDCTLVLNLRVHSPHLSSNVFNR